MINLTPPIQSLCDTHLWHETNCPQCMEALGDTTQFCDIGRIVHLKIDKEIRKTSDIINNFNSEI